MRSRWRRIRGLVRKTILENGALQLERLTANQEGAADAFQFSSRRGLENQFRRWLTEQEDLIVIDASPSSPTGPRTNWQQTYVRNAYGKGVRHADQRLNAAGVDVPADVDLNDVFNRPTHATSLQQLFTRNLEDLETIKRAGDAAVTQAFRQELTEGLAKGFNPNKIARRIVASVNGTIEKVSEHRARMLARTEIINAHATATLNRYEEMGIRRVGGVAEGEVRKQVEFLAAGDDRTCPRCLALEGRAFDLREARGVIPIHPMCRCSWVPITPASTDEVFQRDFVEERFRAVGMSPDQIDPLNPDHPGTKEAISRFGKLRRGTLDLDEEDDFTPFR